MYLCRFQQDRAEEVGEKEEELFLPELPAEVYIIVRGGEKMSSLPIYTLQLMLLLKDAALQDPALLVALLSEVSST